MVEEADARLRELRFDERAEGALGVVSLALAVVATHVQAALALPLLAGGAFLCARAVHACWRRTELVGTLVLDADAYAIPAVQEAGERIASLENRRAMAAALRRELDVPALERSPRIAAAADELTALVCELEDEALRLHPASAVACSRLFFDDCGAVLPTGPASGAELRDRVRHIRCGFSAAQCAPE
jgi:hypothetical protein